MKRQDRRHIFDKGPIFNIRKDIFNSIIRRLKKKKKPNPRDLNRHLPNKRVDSKEALEKICAQKHHSLGKCKLKTTYQNN